MLSSTHVNPPLTLKSVTGPMGGVGAEVPEALALAAVRLSKRSVLARTKHEREAGPG